MGAPARTPSLCRLKSQGPVQTTARWTAAAAYVAMTRGRQHNTAHIVADSVMDARTQWGTVFARDGADLGPAHAAWMAGQAIDQFGPALGRPETSLWRSGLEPEPARHRPYPAPSPMPAPAIGR